MGAGGLWAPGLEEWTEGREVFSESNQHSRHRGKLCDSLSPSLGFRYCFGGGGNSGDVVQDRPELELRARHAWA